jgi:hypothetical protein
VAKMPGTRSANLCLVRTSWRPNFVMEK